MLSRVADNLYWMSRYLERAEHTARLLDVNVHGALEGTSEGAQRQWERLETSLRIPLTGVAMDGRTVTEICALDTANPASIVSCIAAARDNARQAWEQINSEMWEQINRLHLFVSKTTIDEIYRGEPHAFFAAIKQGAHLFQGITDATMSHGEGWQFIRCGARHRASHRHYQSPRRPLQVRRHGARRGVAGIPGMGRVTQVVYRLRSLRQVLQCRHSAAKHRRIPAAQHRVPAFRAVHLLGHQVRVAERSAGR